ncbi:MAG: hypothetical protein ACTSV5_06350 [Promethearchaeota archaeon]
MNALETDSNDVAAYYGIENILAKKSGQRSAIENSILEYSIASMGGINRNNADPEAIKRVDDMKKDLMNMIKEKVKKLEAISGEDRSFDADSEIGNIMLALKNKEVYDTTQLSRIEKALIEIDNQMVDGVHILDSVDGKYGALNLKILEVVEDKIDNGEKLSHLDHEIFKAKALLENNRLVFNGKYPPLHIQGQWDGFSEDSPYYNDFKVFIDNLNDIILKEPNLQEYHGGSSSIYSFLATILDYKTPSIFQAKLDSLKHLTSEGKVRKVGARFKIGEFTLDVWYMRLEKFIRLKLDGRSQEILTQVDKEFNIINKKFGYEAIHPLYGDARLTLARIGQVLVDSEVIGRKQFTMTDIDEIIGSESDQVRMIYKGLLSNPYGKQKYSTIINLVDKILEGAKGKGIFTDLYEEEIRSIRDEYLGKLRLYLKSFDILKNHKPSYRKKLIEVIVGNCEILQSIDDVYKLSWILMGDKDSVPIEGRHRLLNFLLEYKDRDKAPPRVYTIIRILQRVSEWTKDDFSKLGLIVTDEEIDTAKDKIKMIVERWVENAHIFSGIWKKGRLTNQWDPYPPLSLLRVKMETDNEISKLREIVSCLWWACTLKTGSNDLNFEDIKNQGLLGSKRISLLDFIEGDTRANKRFLKGALKSIKTWIQEEAQNDVRNPILKSYYHSISLVALLALKQGMSLKGSGGEKIFNGRRFSEAYIMGYHVFAGLGKHLGVDPISLTVVNDEAFSIKNKELNILKSKSTRIFRWLRHHFRDSLAGRISFLHSDLVITDKKNHALWEALTESESLAVIRGFEKLIAMKGSGAAVDGLNLINIEDIINVFGNGKGNEWVAARWLSEEKFDDNLIAFNDRRRDIRLMGLEKFIEINNPIAHERFSDILKDDRDKFDSFLLELHNELDETDLAPKNVFEFLSTYLRNEGYLINAGPIV